MCGKNETIRLVMNLGPSLTSEKHQKKIIEAGVAYYNPRANGAKRRSGRKPGARVTSSARLFPPG